MKKFSPLAEKALQWYVYSLRCAITNKYVYPGKGKGSRVFDHRNSMHLTDSRKNLWLRNNEFVEYIESTHETEQGAYEAEAAIMSLCKERPEIVIPGGLLNEQSGHHEIRMSAERFDKLYGDKGDFDKEKIDNIFRKEGRRGVILNIMRSENINKKNNISYRELAFGYSNANKARLHLATEIFIRFKGSIVEHWKDVKWNTDPYKDNVWDGKKVDSELAPTRMVCKARKSQASTIYLNIDMNYNNTKLRKKRKERIITNDKLIREFRKHGIQIEKINK
jgi:hypothetical protein